VSVQHQQQTEEGQCYKQLVSPPQHCLCQQCQRQLCDSVGDITVCRCHCCRHRHSADTLTVADSRHRHRNHRTDDDDDDGGGDDSGGGIGRGGGGEGVSPTWRRRSDIDVSSVSQPCDSVDRCQSSSPRGSTKSSSSLTSQNVSLVTGVSVTADNLLTSS